jgi:phosphoenolpyruvate---glycerone phosphotransferase subunit DhaM
MTVSGNGAPTDQSFVSLVLVSHSASIADGLADLVAQVAGPDVRIVTAGGGPEGSLGTDGFRVLEALRAVNSSAGTVVLVDIGSSVLAVRAALNELEEEEAARVLVADGPLVEGAAREAVGQAAEDARSARKL